MHLTADLFWSFRSPYSYLGIKRYLQLTKTHNLNIRMRPVMPIAIRNPEFFQKIDKNWISYLLRDCQRLAQFNELPFTFPSPDPVNMDMQTREISHDQPFIHWITRLGIGAVDADKGLEFADEISSMVWGGTKNWNTDENMNTACKRAGLSFDRLNTAVSGNEAKLDLVISENQASLEKAGHWGVPTLVFENEPFFGQDRIEMALWRMKQNGLVEKT